MTTKFQLNFINIHIPIRISKSVDDGKIGFKRGYNGKPVSMINVVPKFKKVKSKDDIEKIVDNSELEQLYQIDKTEDKYITVNPKAVKETLISKSDQMEILSIIPKKEIDFDILDGNHYFLLLQNTSKKDAPEEHKQLYSMLYYKLIDIEMVILVKYISLNNEKYGIIYPHKNKKILKMSSLIYSNLQREWSDSPINNFKKDDLDINLLDIIFKPYLNDKLDKKLFEDKVSELIEKYIENRVNNPDIPDEENHKKIKPHEASGILKTLLALNKDPYLKNKNKNIKIKRKVIIK
jgi:non-homologous end joining protein Ku